MEAIKEDHKTDQVTTRAAKMENDHIMVLDDFSTNKANNRKYEFACTDQGGNYIELHYNATCETQGRNKKVASIFVVKQPRCYSPMCSQASIYLQALFHDCTILPTQERADLESHSAENWTCSGVQQEPTLSLCQDMSRIVN